MDTKASNRQKFKQNQKFNNHKNYIYKKKHGITKEEQSESDSSDDNTFVKKTANDNTKRYEQQFEEDTEEYIQQQKLTKHLDDEEYKRQLELQNEFIDKNYKNNLNKTKDEYTEDELMNMTTEQLNDLILNKKTDTEGSDFRSRVFRKKVVQEDPVVEKKEPVKDTRSKKIPDVPLSMDASEGKRPSKLRSMDAGEDFLDSLL